MPIILILVLVIGKVGHDVQTGVARSREKIAFVPRFVEYFQIAKKLHVVPMKVDCGQTDSSDIRGTECLRTFEFESFQSVERIDRMQTNVIADRRHHVDDRLQTIEFENVIE